MTINNNYKLENKNWRHNMTKRFNLKSLFLFLTIGIMAIGLSACMNKGMTFSSNELEVNASETGAVDTSGNLITNTVYVTNVIQVTNERVDYITNRVIIPGKEIEQIIYVTNKVNGKDVIYTNYVYIENISYVTEYVTNVVTDMDGYVSKYHKSFMYRVYAPFSGIGAEGEWKYTNVSYLDTDTLSALWKKMMNMESHSGRQFTLRNRTTGTYFFFDSNGDLKWSRKPTTVIKQFVQGVIIQHRCGNDTKGAYAIAGLYKLNRPSDELRTWNDTGVNIVQGELFRRSRPAGEYDIIVMNPGHVINGSEYGFEVYHTTYNFPAGTNPFFEQRPEYIMSKITHVVEAWKNYRPWELHDVTFQQTSTPLPNLWK